MLLGKDDDDWTTKDTQMGERKKSAHLDDPKKEWRKNVSKKCPSFFLPSSFFPSLFTFTFWTRIGRNCEVDSHTPLLRGECLACVSFSTEKRKRAETKGKKKKKKKKKKTRTKSV